MGSATAERPEVAEWREVLDNLYATIRTWLSDKTTWPLGEDLPPTDIQTKPITITVDYPEPYEVPQLLLQKNGRAMWVRPIARRVVGANGRVDLKGTEGPLTLVYQKDKGGWYWVDEGVAGKLRPLTGELFRQLADLCLR